MTVEFYDRSYELSFGGEPVRELQITFDVSLSSLKEPNKLRMTINNLSPDTRAKLVKDVPIELAAGWNDDPQTIFKGALRTVSHLKDGPTWITSIEASDGFAGYVKQASLSFEAKSTFRQVVEGLIDATGLGPGKVANTMATRANELGLNDFERGYVATGRPIDQLSSLARGLGLNLSIQQGILVTLAGTATVTADLVLLSPSSGMIGSPVPGEANTIRLVSLLQPRILPGRRVRVEAEQIEGDYKVITCTHQGNYRGGSWYSNMELRAL